MEWKFRSSQIPSSSDGVAEIVLQNRGILDAQAKKEFLQPKHPRDISLSELGISSVEMQKALDILELAKDQNDKIVVFGDYDADGICATAVVWETLHGLGYRAMPFIPDRRKHGYGLSQVAIEEILADQEPPQVVLTVDNGIVAHSAIALLREAGVTVILTDHHQPDAYGYPEADAVIHTTQLCGTTVGWMLARELNPKVAEQKLDLTAIATIADQVELFKANRSFAVHGLLALQKTTRPGLLGLMESANIDPAKLDAGSVNYGLAPRINAMGRLENPLDALRALCTKNVARAIELTNKLQQTNTTRQEITADMMELATQEAKNQKQQHVLVVASTEFHEGVIGLVAGRLVEQFSKPAVVIALGEQTGKGSARSVAGVNVTNLLRQVREELLDVGGHPMAAGFSLNLDAVEEFRRKLQEFALAQIVPEQLNPALELDCALPSGLIVPALWTLLSQMAPYGAGNPTPTFAIQDLFVTGKDVVGAEGQHLKFRVKTAKNQELSAMAFRAGSQYQDILVSDHIQVAGRIQENEWKGRKQLQIMVNDIHRETEHLLDE